MEYDPTELKTYKITMSITSTCHPRKWIDECILENLDEDGEGFTDSPTIEEI